MKHFTQQAIILLPLLCTHTHTLFTFISSLLRILEYIRGTALWRKRNSSSSGRGGEKSWIYAGYERLPFRFLIVEMFIHARFTLWSVSEKEVQQRQFITRQASNLHQQHVGGNVLLLLCLFLQEFESVFRCFSPSTWRDPVSLSMSSRYKLIYIFSFFSFSFFFFFCFCCWVGEWKLEICN